MSCRWGLPISTFNTNNSICTYMYMYVIWPHARLPARDSYLFSLKAWGEVVFLHLRNVDDFTVCLSFLLMLPRPSLWLFSIKWSSFGTLLMIAATASNDQFVLLINSIIFFHSVFAARCQKGLENVFGRIQLRVKLYRDFAGEFIFRTAVDNSRKRGYLFWIKVCRC